MKRVDRLALPKNLRPGRQFDAAEAQARQKWLRTGPATNRANVRARAAIMLNVYAWRSTDPLALLDVEEPVGPDNDVTIARVVRASARTVMAWRSHVMLKRILGPRTIELRRDLEGMKLPELGHLGRNADGQPKHPLYLPAVTPLWKLRTGDDPCPNAKPAEASSGRSTSTTRDGRASSAASSSATSRKAPAGPATSGTSRTSTRRSTDQ